jgi:hypothetical protein
VTGKVGDNGGQARVRAALAEFETLLERASDDLAIAIADIIPDRFVELEDDDDDGAGDNVARVIKGAIVEYPADDIADAFDDFDWVVKRALRQLREALR